MARADRWLFLRQGEEKRGVCARGRGDQHPTNDRDATEVHAEVAQPWQPLQPIGPPRELLGDQHALVPHQRQVQGAQAPEGDPHARQRVPVLDPDPQAQGLQRLQARQRAQKPGAIGGRHGQIQTQRVQGSRQAPVVERAEPVMGQMKLGHREVLPDAHRHTLHQVETALLQVQLALLETRR